MGQQQLLLLVLSTVIVGLATVAGIQAFEQGSKRANQDALTNTAVKVASDMQANLKKPEQFGGAGLDDMSSNHATGDTPKLKTIGYETTSSPSNKYGITAAKGDFYETTDGVCAISGNAAGTITLKCGSADSEVTVEVTSLDSDGISTEDQKIKS